MRKFDELSVISRLNKIVVPIQDYNKVVKDAVGILRKIFKYDKLKLLLLGEDKPEEIIDEPTNKRINEPMNQRINELKISCKIRGKAKAIITLYSVSGPAG